MKVIARKGDPSKAKTDCIIYGVFEGEKLPGPVLEMDKLLEDVISRAYRQKIFRGKLKEVFSVHTLGRLKADILLLVGLGKKEDLTLDKLRQASGASLKGARNIKAQTVASLLADVSVKGSSRDASAQAVAEGAILSLYKFTRHKTNEEKEEQKEIGSLKFLSAGEKKSGAVSLGINRAIKVCGAVAFARDLISQPGNMATPTYLAAQAKKIAAESALRYKVLDGKEMERLGMGALLGVARGSAQPPKFIILEYRGEAKEVAPIVLVGKGLTFDSGGISIKPSSGMEEMKTDMSGGAAVMGAMMAVADLKLNKNVIGLVPATENMPGGRANKPGDILTAMSGQTIEVVNTDAEGRLILADALCYAERYKPAAVIDVATLTGACVVALGHHVSGVMGTDQDIIDSLMAAGEVTGERVWQLPMYEDYDEQVKSDVADMKNTGGRGGGAITAAAMLKKFTSKYKWVHLDIAGTAWTDKEKPYVPKGAVGVGVRLFVEFLRAM